MVHGAPGHTAHALVNLLRALGVPMMSNRYDRDNYLSINWAQVKTGTLAATHTVTLLVTV